MDITDNEASNREAFEIEDKQEDLTYITVDKPHVAFTICNLLITATCIGLFCFVNSYFAIRLHKVVDNSIIRE